MNSIAALNVLLQRAEVDRNNALSALRQAEAHWQQACQQADQLQAYQGDYDRRWTLQFQQSGTTELLQCHRDFGQRLTQAIGQQHSQAAQLQGQVDKARALLLDRERRVAGVRKLIERRQQELQRLANRRDQRSTDEAAQRAAAVEHGSTAGSPFATRTTRA